MKTLVFSTKVVLDGLPAGFSGMFKMLHLETGELYIYRVHLAKHIYVGSHITGMGSHEENVKWWECMFHGLANFLEEYNITYGYLPTDKNIYQDRRPYTSEKQPFGKKVYFIVEEGKQRPLSEKQLVIHDTTDLPVE
jgi:hypothetical protein